MPEIIKGNILDAKEDYIAQQCNCLTTTPHGLSKAISKAYSWGDPYSTRTALRRNCAIKEHRDSPGTIRILRDPTNTSSKAIVCMFAQWAPGRPRVFKSYPEWDKDTYDARVQWFKSCLNEMKEIETDSIAFPWTIGCGLAGGDWTIYKALIEDFEKESGIKCVFYKLE